MWDSFGNFILSLSDFPERVFDIWLPRLIEAICWQWEYNTLLCLMLIMCFCIFFLHLISHRRLKQEAYHRGFKRGREAR